MKQAVLKYIQENNLINYGDTVICGLSGGADSCAMVSVLNSLKNELGINLVCAHLNHLLRGEEAARDMKFAESFSNSLNIPFYSKSVDVKKLADEKGISLEDAGRTIRYEFFEDLFKKTGAQKIATAHNKNDNTETLLMHIIRGCGVGGLCAIPPKRDNIIRPLLNVSREEIEKYCKETGISYVTDSSNLSPCYTRNKLRLEILPKIREINPSFDDAASRLIASAREETKVTEEILSSFDIAKKDDTVTVDLKDITPAQRSVIGQLIIKAVKLFNPSIEISAKNINILKECILENKQTRVDIATGCSVSLMYEKLVVYNPKPHGEFSFELTPHAPLKINGKEIYISTREEFEFIPWDGKSRVVIRNRRNGDKLKIRNMTKKVQDIFVNLKIERFKRDKLLVITYDDKPVWVENAGRDDSLLQINSNFYIIIKSEEK